MTVEERHQALLSLSAISGRLTAWRDNASIMVKYSSSIADMDRWENEAADYAYLVDCANVVRNILLEEC